AASLGINGALWKAFAFGLGAAIAGLAGCFYPGFVGTLVPDAFNIIESFTMLAMVIVGGMGTMLGPVIGAIVLTFLPELLRGFGELRLMIYGVALTLVVPEKMIYALIGPNGAGKSTLLNLLSGIYQPDAGELTFRGENLIGLPA